MDSTVIGCIAIAIGLVLGLMGIAVSVLFGLRSFRTDIMGDLSIIKEKIIIIQETVRNVWDVFRISPAFGVTSTVEREFKNLGKVKIAAQPQLDATTYILQVTNPILNTAAIDKLSKQTGLEQIEKDMFSGDVPKLESMLPHLMKIVIPSTEPSVCTKYMNLFLKWLDSTYFDSMPKIREFEEPIGI